MNADGADDIILDRTPYGAFAASPSGRSALGDYIVVSQDIRGRGRSQGEFVMNRPARDPRDPKSVDETTDAYDTVEWLIKNVPNNNGRVGVTGISYPGWLAEVVLLDPHPAIKAVSPQAPMTDTWMGDDFFHQGAFRQWYGFRYAWGLEGAKAGAGSQPVRSFDDYEWFLSFPSLKALTDATGAMRIPTWRRFLEHPAWDAEWQGQAFQRLVKHNYWKKADCILVSMGGVPTRACRRFIRRLADDQRLPVLAFTDGDPYGYCNIYRTLKVGSGQAAHIKQFNKMHQWFLENPQASPDDYTKAA